MLTGILHSAKQWPAVSRARVVTMHKRGNVKLRPAIPDSTPWYLKQRPTAPLTVRNGFPRGRFLLSECRRTHSLVFHSILTPVTSQGLSLLPLCSEFHHTDTSQCRQQDLHARVMTPRHHGHPHHAVTHPVQGWVLLPQTPAHCPSAASHLQRGGGPPAAPSACVLLPASYRRSCQACTAAPVCCAAVLCQQCRCVLVQCPAGGPSQGAGPRRSNGRPCVPPAGTER